MQNDPRAFGPYQIRFKMIRSDNQRPVYIDLLFAVKFLYIAVLHGFTGLPSDFFERCAHHCAELRDFIREAPELNLHGFEDERHGFTLKVRLPDGLFSVSLGNILACLYLTGEDLLGLEEGFFPQFAGRYPELNETVKRTAAEGA